MGKGKGKQDPVANFQIYSLLIIITIITIIMKRSIQNIAPRLIY